MLTQPTHPEGNVALTDAPAADFDAIQKELMDVLTDIAQARNSRGQPGHLAKLAVAEIASGRFVAQHGWALLHLITERQRRRAA